MGQLVFWVFWANSHLAMVANCSVGVRCPCLEGHRPRRVIRYTRGLRGVAWLFLASPGGGVGRAGGRRRKRKGLGGSSDAAAEDAGSRRLVKCTEGGRPRRRARGGVRRSPPNPCAPPGG